MGSSPCFRLFLSASGSIGKTLTATRWKGVQYWRPYAKPGASRSPDQAIVRRMFGQAHEAWRRDFKSSQVRDDWDRAASYSGAKMSGYDMFIASAYHATVNDPSAVFATTYYQSGDHLVFAPASIKAGVDPMESQPIDIWMGYNPHKQDRWDTRQFHAGILWTPAFPGPGTYYIRMTSDGVPVSGLIRFIYKGP